MTTGIEPHDESGTPDRARAATPDSGSNPGSELGSGPEPGSGSESGSGSELGAGPEPGPGLEPAVAPGEGVRPAVVEQLGMRIRAARQDQDLSVGGLAELSGVSRRMLTQIELGQANPSVSILDRIAAGLGTTFAALVGVGADDAPEGVEIWSTGTGSWAVLLDAVDTETLSVETWKWRLLGGDAYRGGSGIPSPGIMHHVIDGALEIDTGDDVQIIEAGGSGRVVTAGDYRYRAHEQQAAVFFTVALQPRLPR